jgi:hypothetical protein
MQIASRHKYRQIVRPRDEKAPVSFLTEALILSFAVLLYRLYLLAIGPPVVTRNSVNSVELLIFVTNQGSGPRLVDTCSWMTRPIGVGPKAIE